MCISGIYSLSNEVISGTESTISTGAVDIELKEYNSNNEIFNDFGNIMPGEEIELIPRINNLGVDCYLRMKVSYTIGDKDINELDYISGNYTSWEYKDGYYYYDSILNKNDSIDLFNKISIPDDIKDEDQGKDVNVNVIVEAIQAKNFDGNWEGIEIKKSVNRSYDVDASGESTVIYENNAQEYLTLNDGFFDNIAGLLPGDIVSEDVKILNSSDNKIEYYLSVESNDLTDEEKNLLERIILTVKNGNGEVIKEVSLLDAKDILLGEYDALEEENLVLGVSLPVELDNDFSKILTKITWKFSLNVTEERTPVNPITGDWKFDVSMTVFLLSAIGFLVVLFLEKKETENIENK